MITTTKKQNLKSIPLRDVVEVLGTGEGVEMVLVADEVDELLDAVYLSWSIFGVDCGVDEPS